MNDKIVFALAAINIIAFVLCVYDKAAAKSDARRIPEKTLLSVAAAFGSYGMLAGMYLVRHKTKHLKFTVLVPVMAVFHTLAIYGVFRPQ